jgi:hemerythrin-like metal-binding protein
MLNDFQGSRPDWFYRLLPYLYATAGVLTIIVLRNSLAIFSGCLLITAGGMVWWMRRNRRREAAARSLPGRPRPGLIDIVWRQSFNSGNRLIDGQHRSLFSLANRLTDELTNHMPEPKVKETIRELIQDIQAHFKAEEEVLAQAAPGMAEPHKLIHARLIKEVGEIADRVVHKMAPARELIGFILYDVIADHLTQEDTKFFPLVKNLRDLS